jgi:hypothetical protein
MEPALRGSGEFWVDMTAPGSCEGPEELSRLSRATSPAGSAGEVAAQHQLAWPGSLSRRAKKSMLAAYERHEPRKLPALSAEFKLEI